MIRKTFCIAAVGVASLLVAGGAQAGYTLDRHYRMGDLDIGLTSPAPINQTVTFASTFDASLDNVGLTSGNGGVNELPFLSTPERLFGIDGVTTGSSPTYRDVSGRPTLSAGANQFAPAVGIEFNGTDQYLSAADVQLTAELGGTYNKPQALGNPATSISSSFGDGIGGTGSSTGSGSIDYEGIDDRGMQFWVRPTNVAGGDQSIVSDTNSHGVRIEGGNWTMRYDGTDVDSGVAAVDNNWSHVFQVAGPALSGSVLYIDGNAVAAAGGGYSFTVDAGFDTLIVGASDNDTNGTREDHFAGFVDDLEMFVWGTTDTSAIDYGTLDVFADNAFIADALSSSLGDADVNANGVLEYGGANGTADIDAFIAGWNAGPNLVNGFVIADLGTRITGDINLDGDVDFNDLFLINQANAGGGLAISQALNGGGVPEPSTIAIIAAPAIALLVWRRKSV